MFAVNAWLLEAGTKHALAAIDAIERREYVPPFMVVATADCDDRRELRNRPQQRQPHPVPAWRNAPVCGSHGHAQGVR
jgi:hypothetical protein